jgi:putative transposase
VSRRFLCVDAQAIRVDNGPEYVSGKLIEWAEKRNVRLEYIQPGKPQQRAYIARYNRTVRRSHRYCVSTAGQRDEWLSQFIFETIEEAQEQATEWLWTYNTERPNMGIGGITPAMKLKTAA